MNCEKDNCLNKENEECVEERDAMGIDMDIDDEVIEEKSESPTLS